MVVVEAYALIYNRREKLKGMKVWVFVCAAARGEGWSIIKGHCTLSSDSQGFVISARATTSAI